VGLQVLGSQSLEVAKVVKEAARHFEERHCEHGRPENSRWNKCAAIPEDQESVEARQNYHEALAIYKANNIRYSTEIADCYMSLAKLVKPNGESQVSQLDLMNQAIDTLEFCLGFDHPETGESYARMGLACQEAGNYKGASLGLRRAFCVFFKSLGPNDSVTLGVHQQMVQVDENLDRADISHLPYQEQPQAILDIEK